MRAVQRSAVGYLCTRYALLEGATWDQVGEYEHGGGRRTLGVSACVTHAAIATWFNSAFATHQYALFTTVRVWACGTGSDEIACMATERWTTTRRRESPAHRARSSKRPSHLCQTLGISAKAVIGGERMLGGGGEHKKKPTETGQSSETQRNGLLNLPKVLCGFGIDIPRTSLAAVGHDCYQYLHHPPAGEKRLRGRTLEGPSACNVRQDTFAWLDGGT